MKQKIYLITLLAALAVTSCKKNEINTKPSAPLAETMAGTSNGRLSNVDFDWVTVPVAADIADRTRDFSSSEIEFLGRQFKILSIEKGHGSDRYTEDGFLKAANALKASNPKLTVLYYWNSNICYPYYKSTASVSDNWITRNPGDSKHRKFYKMELPACRTWWVKNAVAMAAKNNVDGIFVDGLTPLYKKTPEIAIALLKELREELNTLSGSPRLIFYNSSVSKSSEGKLGIANADVTALQPLLNIADGIYIESFYCIDLKRNVATEDIRHMLKSIQFASKQKKAVVIKAWPEFSIFDKGNYVENHGYENLVNKAKSEISFPLAAFLVAAGQYSYFQYSWGWVHNSATVDHGTFIRESENSQIVDPQWYTELRRPLGVPLGNATINGDVWTRKFAHATVTANLAQKTGHITWDILDFFPRG